MSLGEAAAWLVFEKGEDEGSYPGSVQGQAEWGGSESQTPQAKPAQMGSDHAQLPALPRAPALSSDQVLTQQPSV